MTNAQLTALGYGFAAFLVIWSVILIPQLITQYARSGQLEPRRIVSTGAVLLYFCLVVAVVLFPLPTAGTSALSQTIQLEPFRWVDDVGHELSRHGLAVTNILQTKAFQQTLMNVALFVPLGIFARLLWRRGLVGTISIGFGISMLIEVTQLTANFGTAPYVYRVFDVDDLITNTTGAGVGWIIAALALVTIRTLQRREVPASDLQPVSRERVYLAQSR